MKQTLIVCKGIQGSGKSFWSKQYVREHPGFIRINNDSLRLMFFDRQFDEKDTKYINYYRELLIEEMLKDGSSVIVDNMNLDPKYESRYRSMAERHGCNFEIKSFTDVPLDVCIQRDSKRENHVGKKIITKMYNQFIRKEPFIASQDDSLPRAIICDVDNTLSIMDLKVRSPYQEELAGKDKCNWPVRKVLYQFQQAGYKIIICSGRDEGRGRKVLEDWLFQYEIIWDQLLMRPSGDIRKDSIIKKELYENNIKGKYFVEFVMDDRDQVVELWRLDLGLPTFQVNYGDF